MEPAETASGERMKLRYPGACRICGVELAAREDAVYERASKSVRCVACPTAADLEKLRSELEMGVEPTVLDAGVAGASAAREYEWRKAKREERIRARHPKLGGLILALSDDPQSTRTWESGRKGEVTLGARLDEQTSEGLLVLHDRRIRGTKANIDHLVVTAGGVFVVDAKRYVGQRPEVRIEGGILRPRVDRLMVGGRDRTKLVDGVLGQVERVRAALGDEDVSVEGVLCFVEADWPLVGAFFSTRDVRVVSPRRLSKILAESEGEVDLASVRDRLAAAFPRA